MSRFDTISDSKSKNLWLIETSGMSDYHIENAKRVLAGLPEITMVQFLEQENYYK